LILVGLNELKTTRFLLFFTVLLLGFSTLKAQPIANFTVDKIAGCSPLTVTFTSTSTGSPTTYFWAFGNGNTSTNQNPSATYVLPGTYNVALTVTNSSGTDTKTVNSYITVYANPVAQFVASPVTGCIPLSVTFTDQTTGSSAITNWTWDFGNGNTGNTKNPINQYTVPGTFDVTLAVKDANGCENNTIKRTYITATPGFTVDFTSSTNNSCTTPATVGFNSTVSVPGTYTYSWKFGDNTTSTLANPSKTYNTPGAYTVELEVTSSNGCKQKITKTGFVQVANLDAAFTYTTTSSCAPAIVFLTNTSTPSPAGMLYWWQVNGGQDRFSQNTNYSLTSKVNVIQLIIQNAAGCKDTVTKTITLIDGPKADFTVDKDIFCDFPATVNFFDLSKDSPTTWAWNFGNSVGSTSKNTSITYTAEGIYSARLIVGKGGTCRDTAYHSIIVAKPDVTIIDQNKKGGCAPSSIAFDAVDNSKIVLTNWRWELGGTIVATSKSFSYNFPVVGEYVFKLIASNSYGCEYIDYDTVKIGVLPDFEVTTDLDVVCYNPGIVHFKLTQIGNIKPTEIKWDITNGVSSIHATDSNPTIYFNDTGYFLVIVKASSNGCTRELVKPNFVKVNPAVAKFSFYTDSCRNDTVYFFNKSIGSNFLIWDFDDSGATSTQMNPMHVYRYPKYYQVKLIANDVSTGCSDTTFRSVRIIPKAIVGFTPTDTFLCLGSSTTFRSTSILDTSKTIQNWKFSRSDGISVTANPAVFSFPTAGTYGMGLTITDKKGCVYGYYDSVVVKVYNAKPAFTATPLSGCVPFVVSVKDSTICENTIVSQKWNFTPIDSLSSASNTATYTYLQPAANQTAGTTLKLTVTDDKGCVYTSSKIIKNTKPLAAYHTTTTKSCGIDSFTFIPDNTPANSMGPLNYQWYFPAGIVTSTGQAKQLFTGDTSYAIKLVLTDGQGCKDSITKTILVNTKAPKVGFTATPRSIVCYKSQPLILFKDTSHSGGSPILRRDWNFGNSSNTITKIGKDSVTASTFYVKPGKYPVSLRITDSIGCADSTTIPDFVVAGGPIGNYSFTPNNGCNPVTVDFTVTSPNAALFIWDHADGNVDSLTQTHHSYQYTRAGVYYPRLTLLDSSSTCEYGFDAIDSIVVLPLPQPDFDADAKIVCVNRPVLFINQTAPHSSPIVNWKWKFGLEDSVLVQNPGTKSYTTKGRYTVSLEAMDSNGCYGFIEKDSFIAVVDDTIPPAIPLVKRATVISNTEVLFEYLPNSEFDFSKYIVYTSTNQYTQASINDTSLVENSLNTLENPYTYKLIAIDVCQNTSAFSETHQTVELKAIAASNSVALSWTPYLGFDTSMYYEIWRTTPEIGQFSFLASVPGNSTNYSDTSVLCKQPYFYQIHVIETDSLFQHSTSDTAGAVPIYIPTLPTPQNIRATVVNNKVVRLEWHQSPYTREFSYQIYRSEDGGAPVFYKQFSSGDTVLTDVNVDVQSHSYTYTTYIIDACGGKSAPSNVAKTILLNVHMVGNDILKHDPKLTWSAYEGWTSGVDHYIADFYNDEQQRFTIVATTDPSLLEATHKYVNLEQADYCYKITGYQLGDSSIYSESNINCVSTEPRLFAPNVFTVNSDNLNDQFKVKGVFIETFELKIYNRWGQLVYESHDMNAGWDGTFEGQPCKPDVFVYTAEGIGKKGKRATISGNITLLR
jgi:gliding motility-associated-like protein